MSQYEEGYFRSIFSSGFSDNFPAFSEHIEGSRFNIRRPSYRRISEPVFRDKNSFPRIFAEPGSPPAKGAVGNDMAFTEAHQVEIPFRSKRMTHQMRIF